MEIKVREFTTREREEYLQQKYVEFMWYYRHTELTVGEIMEKMDINNRNKVARYIREQLRKEGYNSSKRYDLIKKGEWLKWEME